MAKPFDATTKRLLELDPDGWLACLGLPATGPVRAVDSDLSTVTAEADTILQVGDPVDDLAHLEIQSGHDLALPARLLHYNVLLNYRHDRPVRSVVVLLRKEADSPALTGRHQVRLSDGSIYLDFRYSVVRIWKLDVERILQGGPGLLPLATLAKVARKDVRTIIARMKGRLEREVPENQASLLWASTKILMGLRCPGEFVDTILQGVQGMKESVTYQAILKEGRVEGLIATRKEDLLFIGRNRFGPPERRIVSAIETIEDAERLKRLVERSFDVADWEELLSTP